MTLTATESGWIQVIAVLLVLFLLHIPLGDYIARRLGPSTADADMAPHWRVERWIYRLSGSNPDDEQNWRQYLRSVLGLSAVDILVLYAVLRLQQHLPFSEGHSGMSPVLAWDTAVSFVTNTSWQNYSPEATTGYTAVIVGLGIEAFASAAVGLAVSLALVRGLTRKQTDELGNFWVDFARSITRVLIPLSVVSGIVLIWLGVVQTWGGPVTVHQIAGGTQPMLVGPVGAWEPIKLMPGDGGGLLLSAMMLGEISPGGIGSGLYGLLMIALIAVFLGGLMVGRTPEFLRKQISAREMRQVALYYLATPFVLLTGTALAMGRPGEHASMNNPGPHGFS